MNILAIDFGTKRIGLAKVNTKVKVVLPYGVISGEDLRLKIKDLADLIISDKIDKVVVGFPLGLDGKENENTNRVRGFVKELEYSTNIPVEFIDERFSSAQADAMGKGASRDEKSAMVILQSYLEKIS